MQSRKTKYKYSENDKAYVILDDTYDVVEVTVLKRLKKPFRTSDNFYLCRWYHKGMTQIGIRYEREMYKDYMKLLYKAKEMKEEDGRKETYGW